MKPLIEITSLLYLRRLARELNALPDGFYYDGQRYTQASATCADASKMSPKSTDTGMLRLTRRISAEGNHSSYASVGITGESAQGIIDAQGRSVCASRKAP